MDKKKLHLANWDLVITPISSGRLGIQKISGKNFALLASLNWRFLKNKNQLWAKVLANKCTYRGQMPNYKSYSYDSYIRKILVSSFSLFFTCISWNIGDGYNIFIWKDKWIEASYSLRQVIQGPIHESKNKLLVSHLLTNNNWDLSNLSFGIPNDIRSPILNTYIQTSPHKKDKLFWNQSIHGNFNTKSAYIMYLSSINKTITNTNQIHDWVWKIW